MFPRRSAALTRLRKAGIDVGVNVMPILPGITDAPEQLDALVRQVKQFQLSEGLIPDGAVGPQTLLRLSGVADLEASIAACCAK